jgi:hypothetical protein
MSTQVTLTLSDELYEQAQRWAAITQRDLSETLTDALTVVLTPVHTTPEFEQPMATLSDEQVLTLSQVQMEANLGERLGALLEKQREGTLAEAEHSELLALCRLGGLA